MTTTIDRIQEFRESVHAPLADNSIDEQHGVIRGVKILGKVSKNGVTYTDQAMRDGAHLYEGVDVNIDHPDRSNPKAERGVMETIGFLENVRWQNDGLYGDLNYYKEHPSTALLLERARRNPKGFGLSHNADGRYVRTKEGLVIEELRKVRSVDVVGKPATTKGLYESVDPDITEEIAMTKLSLKALVESHGSEDFKKHMSLLEDASVLDREVEIDESLEGEDAVKAGFNKAVADAHAEGEVDKVLAAEKQLKEGVEQEEESSDGPTLESVLEENQKLKAKIEQHEKEQSVLTLCESEGFKPNDIQKETLLLLESADKRVQLIESWRDKSKPPTSGRHQKIDEGLESYEEMRAKLFADSK